MNQEVVYGILANGLSIVIAPRQETSSVATWIFAKGGSDYEDASTNGVHHFLEHMYFKGTKKRSTSRDIWSSIEWRGGEMNAQTDREVVGYGTVMDSKHLELNLELLADILLHSRFDPADIKLEKGPILEEKKGDDDVPQQRVYDIWDQWLHPDCAWGLPIIGTEENIKSMDSDKLISCMRERYHFGSMVLSIAGNVDPGEVMKLVNKYFAKARNGKASMPPKGFEQQESPRLNLQYQETEQTHLVLGVRGYDLFHPRKCAFELLGVILGGNSSSRLFTEIRNQRGLAYAVYTHNHMYTNRGELGAYAGIDHANLVETIKLILLEFKKATRGEITATELEGAREYVLGKMGRAIENSGNLAALLGISKLFQEPNQTPWQEKEAVKKVTLDEINAVAQDIFKNERLNLVVIGPHKNRRQLEKILKI